ncbi:MAG: ribonuclease III [Chloroflexi bacterium RBG_13_51_52]|nr:MAG: ribonuclease III [Chloroflexi bacterium RBG_13_51_52]
MSDIVKLQKKLKVSFKNPALLEQALVHSSYINENPDYIVGHNERLEFLGDAVLDFIVADKLYQEFSNLNEGEMTKLRAALVKRDTLAQLARAIKLGDFLYMGKGEESTGGRNKSPNLAGALESVIAAVYLDLGIDTTRDLVSRLLAEEWKKITGPSAGIDYKSKLQELTQSKYQSTPIYRLVSETGPDHDKTFTVEVMIEKKAFGSGTGKSKKLAETEAARLALKRLATDFTE